MRRGFFRGFSERLFDHTGLTREQIKTLNLIIIAAMGGMMFGTITGGFAYVSFWKALGISNFLYGIIIAMPPVFNALQVFASYLLEKWLPREKTFIVTGIIQRSVWIVFGFVPFIVPMEYPTLRIWLAAVLALISAGTVPLFNSALYSLYDDAVPVRIRGRYFSVRSRITTAAALVAGLSLGRLPDVLPGFTGYAVMFTIAGVLGVADIILFCFMTFPPMHRTESPKFGAMFKKVLADKNYMRLVAFGTVWTFSSFLCGGFTGPYLVSMGMSNMQGTLLSQVTTGVFGVLAVTSWGRGYDKYGTRPVFIINTRLCLLFPLLWCFVQPGMVWLIFVIYMISGLLSYAYEVGIQNLFMGQSPPENRTMYIAVYFIGTQLLGSAFASALGGWLLDNVFSRVEALQWRVLWMYPTRYHYQFFVAFLIRIGALFLLPGVKEEGSYTVGETLEQMRAGFTGAIQFRTRSIMNRMRRT